MGYGNANMRHAAEERKSMVMQVAAVNDSFVFLSHAAPYSYLSFIWLLWQTIISAQHTLLLLLNIHLLPKKEEGGR